MIGALKNGLDFFISIGIMERKMLRYLSIDCEMGGRELKYSLLSAAFVVFDEHFNQIGKLVFKLKPDNGDYFVSGQGMSVNRINLVDHDKIAVLYKDAKTQLYNFLKSKSEDSKVRLIPLGHGVRGDMDHIFNAPLISFGSWEQFCTYHYIDTSVVLQYLRGIGKMPLDCDGSVGALAEYFGVPVEGDLHDEYVDAVTTAKVYQKMIEAGKR